MTFSLENIHSTLNKKHDTLTVFTYAQSFASSMKESVKWLVEWMPYYFTPREIWYSLPMKLEELKFLRRKKIHRYCPRMKIEKCKSGHHQMVLFSDKEMEARILQWQGARLCQKIHITKNSNQSVMQTIVTNLKVRATFQSMIVMKLAPRARKMIKGIVELGKNFWNINWKYVSNKTLIKIFQECKVQPSLLTITLWIYIFCKSWTALNCNTPNDYISYFNFDLLSL